MKIFRLIIYFFIFGFTINPNLFSQQLTTLKLNSTGEFSQTHYDLNKLNQPSKSKDSWYNYETQLNSDCFKNYFRLNRKTAPTLVSFHKFSCNSHSLFQLQTTIDTTKYRLQFYIIENESDIICEYKLHYLNLDFVVYCKDSINIVAAITPKQTIEPKLIKLNLPAFTIVPILTNKVQSSQNNISVNQLGTINTMDRKSVISHSVKSQPYSIFNLTYDRGMNFIVREISVNSPCYLEINSNVFFNSTDFTDHYLFKGKIVQLDSILNSIHNRNYSSKVDLFPHLFFPDSGTYTLITASQYSTGMLNLPHYRGAENWNDIVNFSEKMELTMSKKVNYDNNTEPQFATLINSNNLSQSYSSSYSYKIFQDPNNIIESANKPSFPNFANTEFLSKKTLYYYVLKPPTGKFSLSGKNLLLYKGNAISDPNLCRNLKTCISPKESINNVNYYNVNGKFFYTIVSYEPINELALIEDYKNNNATENFDGCFELCCSETGGLFLSILFGSGGLIWLLLDL